MQRSTSPTPLARAGSARQVHGAVGRWAAMAGAPARLLSGVQSRAGMSNACRRPGPPPRCAASPADERCLKYAVEELHGWLHLALGASFAGSADAGLHALAQTATFGMD